MKNIKKFENFQEDTKTYELGDKYSIDFDYEGMLEALLNITEDTSEEDVEKIYKSLVDVNYHKEARTLDAYLTSIKEDNKDLDLLKKLQKEVKEEYFSVDESNEELVALPVDVYRNNLGDSTANGLSSKKDSLMLVFDNLESPFKTKEGEDYLVLKEKDVFGKVYKYVVPNSILENGDHPMFGGNFVYSSDSRFPHKYPLAVHDRVER